MSVAAVRYQAFGFTECVFYIACAVHGKHRRQLFVSKFFAKSHAFDFADKNLGPFRHGNSGKSGNRNRLLPHYFCVKSAVDENYAAHFPCFGRA